MTAMRLLLSGGPGAGCTTTAAAIAREFGLAHFDSDDFFHRPTDPPYREPHGAEERRARLGEALASRSSWVLSGSIATWGITGLGFTHGVLLAVDPEERLRRLRKREQARFGTRIAEGGDMQAEHSAFLEWAATYEVGDEHGRNLRTGAAFIALHCPRRLTLSGTSPPATILELTRRFLSEGNP